MAAATEESAVKVCVRVRPLIEREEIAASESSKPVQLYWKAEKKCIQQIDDGNPIKSFSFDRVFSAKETTNQLYQDIAKPLVVSTVEGYNGTIFAYGQTSSGKTFTMMGNNLIPGVIPLAMEDVFETIKNFPKKEFLLRVSYMEIYNETVTDLLVDSWKRKPLEVRETINKNIFVADLTEELVTSPAQALAWICKGEKNRHYGKTKMNQRSSRSHTIFRMILESRIRCDPVSGENADGAIIVSHLNLVDLAGSERASQTGAEGARFKEGCNINRSLFILGQVIKKLSEESQRGFTNYRDSKLTRILQNSLGGNAKTVIICTITSATMDETLSTLQFASTAKNMKNDPHVTEVSDDGALLKRYRNEIVDLKRRLQEVSSVTQTTATEKETLSQILQEKDQLQREQEDRIRNLTKLLVTSSNFVPIKKMPKRRMTWGGKLLRLGQTSDNNDDDCPDHSFAEPVGRKRKVNCSSIGELAEDDEEFDSRWEIPFETTTDIENQNSITFRIFGDSPKEFPLDQMQELSDKVSSLELQLNVEEAQKAEALAKADTLGATVAKLELQLETENRQKVEDAEMVQILEMRAADLERQLEDQRQVSDADEQMKYEFSETIQLCETLVLEKETVSSERDNMKQELGFMVEQVKLLEAEKTTLTRELQEKRDEDEFNALEQDFRKDHERELQNEISSLKKAAELSELKHRELESKLGSMSEELQRKSDWVGELERLNDKDLVTQVSQLRRSLDDAEILSRDTRKEWAVLRSQNIAMKERDAELSASHDKMAAELSRLSSQLEAEKLRYRRMQSDLQKELNVAFDDNTKLTALLNGKVPKQLLDSVELQRTVSDLRKDLAAAGEAEAALYSELTSLRVLPEKVEQLTLQVAELTEELCLVQTQRDGLLSAQDEARQLRDGLDGSQQEILQLQGELSRARQSQEGSVQSCRDATEQVAALRGDLERCQEEKNQLLCTVEEKGSKLQEFEQQRASLEGKLGEMQRQMNCLEEKLADGELSRSTEEEISRELQQQLNQLNAELEVVRSERDQTAGAQTLREEVENLLCRVSALTQEKNQQKEILEAVTEERDQLKTDLQDNVEMMIENQEELRVALDSNRELRGRIKQLGTIQASNQNSCAAGTSSAQMEKLQSRITTLAAELEAVRSERGEAAGVQSCTEEVGELLSRVSALTQEKNQQQEILEALTKEKNQQQEILEALTQEKNQQQEILEALTQEKNQQQEILEALTQEKNQQQEILEALRQEKNELRAQLEEQMETIHGDIQPLGFELQLVKEEQNLFQVKRLEEQLESITKQHSQLNIEFKDSAEILEALRQEKNQQQVILETVTQEKNQQQEILEALTQEKNQQQEILEALTQEKNQQQEILEALTQEKNQQQEILEALTQEKNQQQEVLREEKNQQQEILEALTQEKNQLTAQLEEHLEHPRASYSRLEDSSLQLQVHGDIQPLGFELQSVKEEQNLFQVKCLEEQLESITKRHSQLNIEFKDSAEILEALRQEKNQQQEVLETLTQENNKQQEIVETLTQEKNHQQEILEALNQEKNHQQEVLEALTQERIQQQEILEVLREERNQQQEILEALTQENNKQQETVESLTQEKIKQQEIVETLTQEKNHQQEILEALNQEKNLQQEVLEALTQERIQQQEILEDLREKRNLQQEILEALTQEKNQPQEILETLRQEKNQQKEILETLTQENNKQQKTVETLTQEKIQQQEVLEALTQEKFQQQEILEVLREERNQQQEILEALTQENNKQQKTVETLTQEKIQQQEVLEALTQEKFQQQEILEVLREERNQQPEILEALTQENNKQQETVETLTQEKIKQQEIVETLTQENNQQQEVLEALTQEKIQQQEILEDLREERNQQQEILEALTQENNKQQETVETLTQEKNHQQEILEALTQEKNQQQEILEALTQEKIQQQEILEVLREERNQQHEILEALTQEKNKQQETVETLTQEKNQQQEIQGALREERNQQQEILEALREERNQQQEILEALTQEKNQQQELQEALRFEKNQQQKILEALTQEKNQLTAQLEERPEHPRTSDSRLQDSTLQLQEALSRFQLLAEDCSRCSGSVDPLAEVSALPQATMHQLLLSLPKHIVKVYSAVCLRTMHNLQTLDKTAMLLRSDALDVRRNFQDLLLGELAVFEERRLQDLLLCRAQNSGSSMGGENLHVVWERRLAELLEQREHHLQNMTRLLEKLGEKLSAFPLSVSEEQVEKERYNERLTAVCSKQPLDLPALESVLSAELSRCSSVEEANRTAYQLFLDQDLAVSSDLEQRLHRTQDLLEDEKRKSATLLQALGDPALKTELQLLQENQCMALQLQHSKEELKAACAQVEQTHELQVQASNQKRATQLLQTELQDACAQVEEKESSIQTLKSKLRESEEYARRNASPSAVELEKLRDQVIKLEVALASASTKHQDEVERTNALLNIKEEAVRKLKENLRKLQQHGDESFLEGADLYSRLTEPRARFVQCSIQLEKSKLEEEVKQLHKKTEHLESLVSEQREETSKWKARAVKLKEKSKMDAPSTACSPLKRRLPLNVETSVLSSPKKFLGATQMASPKKLPGSPRKLWDSQNQSFFHSPKSEFVNSDGGSQLLSRILPKQFFDNSALGHPPDAADGVDVQEQWPLSPQQKDLCKTQ